MQQLLFANISGPAETVKPAEPPPIVPKRGPGRPPTYTPEEKARRIAERTANLTKQNGTGGAKLNAGRPRNDGTSRFDDPNALAVPSGSVQETMKAYNEARAKREAADAIKAEVLAKKAILEYEVQQGNYLPRDAIISATARAYSALAQGIRSIPDLLERRLGLDPMVCVKIAEIQDEALASLHVDLEKMLTPEEEKGAENGQ